MGADSIMVVCLVCGHRLMTERRLGTDVCGACGSSGQLSTLYVTEHSRNRRPISGVPLMRQAVIDRRRG